MKIGLIVPGGVDRSGEYRVIPVLLALIRQLSLDHEIHVFAIRQESSPGEWQLGGATIHNLGAPPSAVRALRFVLREHRKSPFHVIQSLWAGASGAIAIVAARFLGIPSIVHVAGGELIAIEDIAYGGLRTWKGRLLQRCVLRFATAITAPSEPICDLVVAHGRTPQKIPLGIDLDRWPLRSPKRRPNGRPARLINVASLNLVKDQQTLLNAMRKLLDRGYDFHLDIVGDDTLDGRIQALARTLGLAQHVTFHGFLTQRELRVVTESADVAVISSRHEAGPIAVIEAAGVGVPTVGTAVGHIAEWAPGAAIAVPTRDPESLALAIETLLRDEDLRLHLASAALVRASSATSDNTARKFLDLYHRLADGKS